jgi:hypothetical protein
MPISSDVKQIFNTSVGTVEVLVDRESRTISIYRFDAEHRAIAAAIESWDHVDLLDVLNRQAGVPLTKRIALLPSCANSTCRSARSRSGSRRQNESGAGACSRTPAFRFASSPSSWIS